MHAGQAEYQHDADRGNHCIHHGYLKQNIKTGMPARAAIGNGRSRAGVKEVLLEGAHFAAERPPVKNLWRGRSIKKRLKKPIS
jgi:hypothetical protein